MNISKLKDVKFMKKMTYVYLLCMVLPIIVIFASFIYSISRHLNSQQRMQTEKILENTSRQISDYLETGIKLSNNLYLSKEISKKLDIEEYIDKFSGVIAANDLDDMLQSMVINLENSFSYVNIYTRNKSINNGISVKQLSEQVQREEWYNIFISSNKELLIYKEQSAENRTQISILRKLNTGHESIAKIDLDMLYIQQILQQQNFFDGIYLIDENGEIICSSGGDLTQALDRKATVSLDISRGWSIVCKGYKKKISGILYRELYVFLIEMLIVFLVSLFMFSKIAQSVSGRIEVLMKHMQLLGNDVYEELDTDEFGKDEIGVIAHGLNDATHKIQNLINEVYVSRIENTEIMLENKRAELSALYSHINPHFLFNILEVIRMRSLQKNERETAEIIKLLSRIFRRSISWDEQLVTVADEISFVEEFITIQQYRFENRLKFEKHMDTSAAEMRVPRMIILLLVENSCMHGLIPAREDNRISVTVKRNGDTLYLMSEDNGRGMDAETVSRIMNDDDYKSSKNIGLSNLKKRLSLYYSNQFEFLITSNENEFTRTEITIYDAERRTLENA